MPKIFRYLPVCVEFFLSIFTRESEAYRPAEKCNFLPKNHTETPDLLVYTYSWVFPLTTIEIIWPKSLFWGPETAENILLLYDFQVK